MAINFTSQIQSLYAANVANDAAYQSPGTYGIPAVDINGGITAITVGAAGTGYTGLPTVTISGSGGATAVSRLKVISATVAAAGTGGTAGTQTVTGTTGTGTKFTASVTVNGGGGIASVDSITLGGVYSVVPTSLSNEPVTGANLSGAQLSLVLGVASVIVTKPGAYSTPPTIGFTGGAGNSATATATISNAVESRLLMLIEVFRAFVASTSNREELYAARDIMRQMLGRIHGGVNSGNFNASTVATSVQRRGVQKYATMARSDY